MSYLSPRPPFLVLNTSEVSSSVYIPCLVGPGTGIWAPNPEHLNGYVVFQNRRHLEFPAILLGRLFWHHQFLLKTDTNHVAALSPHRWASQIQAPCLTFFSLLLTHNTQHSSTMTLAKKWLLNVWQRDEEEKYRVTAWPLLIQVRCTPAPNPDHTADEGQGLQSEPSRVHTWFHHLEGLASSEISPYFNFSCAKWSY